MTLTLTFFLLILHCLPPPPPKRSDQTSSSEKSSNPTLPTSSSPQGSASACYDDLYDVVCYTTASTMVVVALDGLDLTCELKFRIPARRSVISTDRVCPRRCE
ncbi:cinnamoyl ester hydrolase [Striga asiatica]|uniref:Cinnamoyl ester hydrolase n=1 Tax=Striga asiatica TaxID=4170 RepID=A0A5A7PUU3_STRAF|nr:cinnamoyl ester hydrolase [Striga asiatica]